MTHYLRLITTRPRREVVIMHHFAQVLVYVSDAVRLQPLQEVVGAVCNETDQPFLVVLQADDECVDTENVG